MTMPREEIQKRIVLLLAKHFEIDPALVKDAASFRGSLGLDSADVIDFVSLLERDFGFEELEGYERLHTVKQVVDFIVAELAKAKDGAESS